MADRKLRPCGIGAKANGKPIDWPFPTPHDSDDAVVDAAGAAPLLDANRHRGGLDLERCVVSRQIVPRGLMGPAGRLLHMARPRIIRPGQLEFADSLDPRAAVPPGNDEANGCAMIGRERLAVHPDGKKGAELVERSERKDPARAGASISCNSPIHQVTDSPIHRLRTATL